MYLKINECFLYISKKEECLLLNYNNPSNENMKCKNSENHCVDFSIGDCLLCPEGFLNPSD